MTLSFSGNKGSCFPSILIESQDTTIFKNTLYSDKLFQSKFRTDEKIKSKSKFTKNKHKIVNLHLNTAIVIGLWITTQAGRRIEHECRALNDDMAT